MVVLIQSDRVFCKVNGAWKKYAKPTIYGVRVEKNNSDPEARVTYIEDNAGWSKGTVSDPGNWLTGNTPFTGIKPVQLSNGVWSDLNKTDLSIKADGSSSNILDPGCDVFTEVPTWWLSITDDGTYQYFRFADTKIDDTYFKLASLWNGQDVGMFHYGCFHGHVYGEELRSQPTKPSVSTAIPNFITYAQSRGSGYDIETWHIHNYIASLCLLYFGTTNLQTILAGYVNASSIDTESITRFSNSLGISGSASQSKHMSFLWINDLWGNVFSYIGGVKTDSMRDLQTLDNGEPCTVSSGAGWVNHNVITTTGSFQFIIDMSCKDTSVGLYPYLGGATASTYWADQGNVSPSKFPVKGGYISSKDNAGPFYVNFNLGDANPVSNASTRLVYRAGRQY